MNVVIKECKNYELENMINVINEGIEFLGGWEKYVKPGMKVLLKINLIGPKKPESSAITHCEFVRAITRILNEKGCEVWIGDSAGGAIAGIAPTKQSLIIGGFEKVAEEENAIIKNFDKEGVQKVESVSGLINNMYLAKPMFDADFVINLPKMKTHSAAIYTGAIKNLFGCIPGLKKAEYHKIAPNPSDFGELIADINDALKVGLHIMDGIESMQGEGPTAGIPYNANKIIMSEDPLALDVVVSSMMGLKIENIPILMTAKKRNLGESNLGNISVLGDYEVIPNLENYQMPKRLLSTKKQNYKSIIKVVDFLKTRPEVDRKICVNCNTCVESCPVQAIAKVTKIIDYKKCIECMCCHELCMYQAVKLRNVNKLASIAMKFMKNKH